ncbi:phthiodiolone/phenolphthiodiolone dimycocerosates ketoreductase [Georgenia soli]|uniref:Phthiodiolone/phenolphthiodiolone dimycocerosates ketoreductase n=1 Tax=Georgenia soli TaxID=638953 RepID=A0A2A9EJS2_9MICO|nr:LLM class flavin-dependent oxidoreductase [Georgenia soli]PFG38771.1 phthiodiolone/phenolphthiodiolone dimycocerosates ketoreductase [Georgenia soli]
MNGRVKVGLQLGTQPPLGAVRAYLLAARAMRLDSVMVIDHLQNVFPSALWDADLTWLARRKPTPHDHLDFQAVMGWAATRVGRMQLGVGVTDPIRRHPVVIAQALLTVAHMTRRPPVLGIGVGERLNITPYGLDYAGRTSRLEEALQIIRLCLDADAPGPVDFDGRYFRLDGARVDLRAPAGRTPLMWVAAHGPRSLELAGRYGDGWYPTTITSPGQYATDLAVVRDAAARAGRNPSSVTPALHRFTVIGRTEAEARAMLATRALRSLALVMSAAEWRAAGARHPFGDDFTGLGQFLPEQADRATLERAVDLVPPELLLHGPLLWGTVEQAADRLREYRAAGLEHVILSPVSGLVSPRAALRGLSATGAIARELRRG